MGTAAGAPGDRGPVRPFDFRTVASAGPRRDLGTIERMHDLLTQTVASSLTSSLRARVTIDRVPAEVVPYGDFLRALPELTVLAPLGLEPLGGRGVLELDPQLAMVIVERLLGGPGTRPSMRRLTDIEVGVLEDALRSFVSGIRATFDPIVEVLPTIEDIGFDPRLLQVADGTDTVLVLPFELRIEAEEGTTEGIVTLTYPMAAIQPVLDRLSVTARPVDAADLDGPLADLVPDVPLQVTVRLADSPLRAVELADLRVGDVLRLDHEVGAPARAFVGEAEVFTGHLGRRGPNLALQVASVRRTVAERPSQGTAAGLPAGHAEQHLPEHLPDHVTHPRTDGATP